MTPSLIMICQLVTSGPGRHWSMTYPCTYVSTSIKKKECNAATSLFIPEYCFAQLCFWRVFPLFQGLVVHEFIKLFSFAQVSQRLTHKALPELQTTETRIWAKHSSALSPQTNKQTNRQTDRQTDRQTNKQTNNPIMIQICPNDVAGPTNYSTNMYEHCLVTSGKNPTKSLNHWWNKLCQERQML